VLRELHISGLGIIHDLDLPLTPGLTVLTGETGAGKTMLTVGVSLVVGARASAQLVAAGAPAARVQARFDAPPRWSTDADTEHRHGWVEDGEVILARSVGPDGRSSARIGGQLTTASTLADVGAELIEIHGQHGSLRLLEPATQTRFLDRFAGSTHLAAVRTYVETHRRLEASRRALRALENDVRDREREIDLLRYQVDEIRAVDPRPNETDALQAEASRLAHAERLLELSSAGEEILAGDGGAGEGLATAARGLAAIADLDVAAAAIRDRAEALAAEAAELGRDLRAYRESLALDPARSEALRVRIAELKGLQRKYGAGDDEVLDFLRLATERLQELSGADERLEDLRTDVARLEPAVAESASAVSAGRAEASTALERALSRELEDLGMTGAVIQVVLEQTQEIGPSGAERVELRLRGGAGQPWLPLAKGASGGELSRVMLACRSVLSDLDDVPTLVFDEVDAGIGGAAGLAVGRRLARLSMDRQVVVVTHLPQIACFADLHVRVRKHDGAATLEVLDDLERVRELSRMLAGLETSEHGGSHAEELLEEAARSRQAAAKGSSPMHAAVDRSPR
jgi:DNA repair protein RecN (Recombination protein N)